MNNYGIIFYRNYNNNLLKSFDIVLKDKPSKWKEKGYIIPKKFSYVYSKDYQYITRD